MRNGSHILLHWTNVLFFSPLHFLKAGMTCYFADPDFAWYHTVTLSFCIHKMFTFMVGFFFYVITRILVNFLFCRGRCKEKLFSGWNIVWRSKGGFISTVLWVWLSLINEHIGSTCPLTFSKVTTLACSRDKSKIKCQTYMIADIHPK